MARHHNFTLPADTKVVFTSLANETASRHFMFIKRLGHTPKILSNNLLDTQSMGPYDDPHDIWMFAWYIPANGLGYQDSVWDQTPYPIPALPPELTTDLIRWQEGGTGGAIGSFKGL